MFPGGWDLRAGSRAAAKEDLDIRIPDNDDSLNTFVVNLNVSLDKLDLEVVPFVDGLTGNQVYILVRPRHRSGSCFFLIRGLTRSPRRRTGRVTRSRKWPQIIHLQSWPISKFSWVPIAAPSRSPLYASR